MHQISMCSLQWRIEGANSSNCGEGYSCTYTNTISWSTPSSAAAHGTESAGGVRAHVRRRQCGQTSGSRGASGTRSILDSLTGSPRHQPAATSATTTATAWTSTHQEDVREIERRLQIAMKASAVAPTDMGVPVGVPQTFDEHIKLQFDLLALAFKADITRVGTLLFARDLTGPRTFPESESPTIGFHGGSHHGEDPKRIAVLSKINQYHVKMLAHLIEKLSTTQDGAGTLLDQSLRSHMAA